MENKQLQTATKVFDITIFLTKAVLLILVFWFFGLAIYRVFITPNVSNYVSILFVVWVVGFIIAILEG